MHAAIRSTAPSAVPLPARTPRSTIAAVQLHYRKLAGRELTETEVLRAAARIYVAAMEHAHLRRSVSFCRAGWERDVERRIDPADFTAPKAVVPVRTTPIGDGYVVEMDPALKERVESAMGLGDFALVGQFLTRAVEFHLVLWHFYEDHGRGSWLSIDGCGQRRWFWPFGRPKGAEAEDVAGSRLHHILIDHLD